ncbi:MAG: DUF116 domain-containing protein [Deltaproteobacteria bacterium]|nr:DUF116 domain-containing protein [Deltaproteobacteria bacterium]MBI3754778.1 DUF116 domain-containing protein [Deltaproteobacteria bacterium]
MTKGKSLIEREAEWTGSSESISYQPTKGIFIGLLSFCAFIIIVAGFFFWYIPSVGLVNIHPALPVIFGAALAATSIAILIGAVGLSFAIVKGRDMFLSYKFRGVLIKFFLPLIMMIGGLLRIQKIKIEQAFIEINNQLVKGMGKKFKPERILILMPHCIQYIDCKIKVTQNVRNCVGCGKCEIGELVGLSDEFTIDLFISTGGTIARRKVYEKRPNVIVAVACERDLTSGIQDAYPLPVLAVVNKRPQGYCIGTGVDVASVRNAIRELLR